MTNLNKQAGFWLDVKKGAGLAWNKTKSVAGEVFSKLNMPHIVAGGAGALLGGAASLPTAYLMWNKPSKIQQLLWSIILTTAGGASGFGISYGMKPKKLLKPKTIDLKADRRYGTVLQVRDMIPVLKALKGLPNPSGEDSILAPLFLSFGARRLRKATPFAGPDGNVINGTLDLGAGAAGVYGGYKLADIMHTAAARNAAYKNIRERISNTKPSGGGLTAQVIDAILTNPAFKRTRRGKLKPIKGRSQFEANLQNATANSAPAQTYIDTLKSLYQANVTNAAGAKRYYDKNNVAGKYFYRTLKVLLPLIGMQQAMLHTNDLLGANRTLNHFYNRNTGL